MSPSSSCLPKGENGVCASEVSWLNCCTGRAEGPKFCDDDEGWCCWSKLLPNPESTTSSNWSFFIEAIAAIWYRLQPQTASSGSKISIQSLHLVLPGKFPIHGSKAKWFAANQWSANIPQTHAQATSMVHSLQDQHVSKYKVLGGFHTEVPFLFLENASFSIGKSALESQGELLLVCDRGSDTVYFWETQKCTKFLTF